MTITANNGRVTIYAHPGYYIVTALVAGIMAHVGTVPTDDQAIRLAFRFL